MRLFLIGNFMQLRIHHLRMNNVPSTLLGVVTSILERVRNVWLLLPLSVHVNTKEPHSSESWLGQQRWKERKFR